MLASNFLIVRFAREFGEREVELGVFDFDGLSGKLLIYGASDGLPGCDSMDE